MRFWISVSSVFLIILFSCELDEPLESGSADLIFSTDTIQFDTLLTDRLSTTRRLRVSNPERKGVLVDISLGRADGSPYSMAVNGIFGYAFENVLIPAGDSLLILFTASISERNQSTPYVENDSIIFEWGRKSANIKLRSWGQDVASVDRAIVCDEVWREGKPYVLKDTTIVETDCFLRIEPGTRVFFEPGAALFIRGTLNADGDPDNWIFFRNSREDENYQIAPGQWDAIYFLEGSTNNSVVYSTIENGRIGLRVGTPDEDTLIDLSIRNVIIRNMSESGIQAFSSDVEAENLLIYNVGLHSVFNVIGGFYRYNHCTFVNTPSQFFIEDPIVQVSDFLPISDEEVLANPLDFSMINSVIWSQSDEAFLFAETLNGNIFDLRQNVIRTNEEYPENIVASDILFPGFKDFEAFNYAPDSLSPLINAAIITDLTIDLNGNSRGVLPDIGALEFFPENNK